MQPANGQAAHAPQGSLTGRRGAPKWLTRTLIVLATILTVLAMFAVWANRQLLNTGNWTQTSSELIESPPVREAVSGYLTDQLYANVNVAGELRSGLPTQLKPLAGPAAGALRSVVEKGVNLALERPIVQELWRTANEVAHAEFVKLIKNEGKVVTLPGEGRVVLDLRPILTEAAKRVGVPTSTVAKIPADVAEVEVIKSKELQAMQTGVKVLQTLAIVLPLVALALFALTVFIAAGRRPQTLLAVGAALIVAALVVLVGRSLGGKAVVNTLAKTESVRPAAAAVWSIGTSMLSQVAVAVLLLGIVLIFSGMLGGPTKTAASVRHSLAPTLRDRPQIAFGALGLALLLLFVWGPVAATRSWFGILVIIALAAFGMQMLRLQTATEFPDARATGTFQLRAWAASAAATIAKAGGDVGAEIRAARDRRRGRGESHPPGGGAGGEAGGSGLGGGTGGGAATGSGAAGSATAGGAASAEHRAPAGDLPGQLERLSGLHRQGALTDEEYAAAKKRLIEEGL